MTDLEVFEGWKCIRIADDDVEEFRRPTGERDRQYAGSQTCRQLDTPQVRHRLADVVVESRVDRLHDLIHVVLT